MSGCIKIGSKHLKRRINITRTCDMLHEIDYNAYNLLISTSVFSYYAKTEKIKKLQCCNKGIVCNLFFVFTVEYFLWNNIKITS